MKVTNIKYDLIIFIILLFGISIPLLIKEIKGENASFKLLDLTKILSISLPYYILSIFIFNIIKDLKVFFIFHILIPIALSISIFISILVIIKKYALLDDLKHQFSYKFPDKYLIIFFIYTSLLLALLYNMPSKIGSASNNEFILSSINNKDFFPLLIMISAGIIPLTVEEMLFRYFMINSFRQKITKNNTIILSSLIWTIFHFKFTIDIFIFGIILGLLYYNYGSILLCIVVHLIYNLTVILAPILIFFKIPIFYYFIILSIFQILTFYIIKEIVTVKAFK